jgi:hypothetical protein
MTARPMARASSSSLVLRSPPSFTPRVCRGQGRLRALGYHLGLMLGDRREDMHREPVRLREVDGRELNARLHQAGHEMDVAGEPIELGDDERGAERTARLEGFGELGPIRPLAALDFGELGYDAPVAAVEMVADGFLLRLSVW